MCEDWIILVAKAPRLGLSKTRLAGDIGAESAQRLAEAFVLDTLDLALARPGTRVLIAYAPDDARAWFAERAPQAELVPQPDGDLGARMAAAFAHGLGDQRRCVMIGMDTPHLDPGRLDEAFEALGADSDVVLGPTEDGGYYLIGLKEPAPGLFMDMTWSTAEVLGETLERAGRLGLAECQLPLELDVDDGADLERLRELLRSSSRAPATREALRLIDSQ